MSEPRIEAVRFLNKIEKDKSYSVLSLGDGLKSLSFDDSRDVAFAVNLVYGVLEHKITLDYNISLYLESSLSKLRPDVLNIIRVGAYQLLYMDKIPVSAAVNEAVKASKKLKLAYASGLINAILRKISKNGMKLPDLQKDKLNYYSVLYSVSPEIINLIADDYGYDRIDSIFSVYQGRRPIYVRCNYLKCNQDELVTSLQSEGVTVCGTPLDGCLCVEATGDITRLTAYKNGWFHVQDMSSQLCCRMLDVKENDFVIDCCAAPGGKSFTIAEYLNNTGSLVSCDMYEHKVRLINEGAKRLGITNIKTVCCDAVKLNCEFGNADKVLCDVPCSGFGVIGRKPEIRYKSVSELTSLPLIQKEILYSCAKMVRTGGTLVYSTCTLNKKENDLICDSFLKDNPEFRIASDESYLSYTDRYITIFPDKEGGDGFFIAKFIRG